MPSVYFIWGFVKNIGYIPSLPITLDKLNNRITAADESIKTDMLQQEFDYRVDFVTVTKRRTHRTFISTMN